MYVPTGVRRVSVMTTVREHFEEIEEAIEQLKAVRPEASQLDLLEEATRRVLGHPASYEDVAAFMECIGDRMQRTEREIELLRAEMTVH